MLGFIYTIQADAYNALSKVKGIFQEAQLIDLVKPKLNSSVYRKIKSDVKIRNIYDYICNISNKIYSFCLYKENGENFRKIYLELERVSIYLNQYFRELTGLEWSALVETIQVTVSIMETYIRSCQNQILLGKSLFNNVKQLYLNMFFEDISLRKCLNKL